MADLTILSLCSGVGGLDAGVDLALGGAARVVCYVEREAYCAAVLASRMEEKALDAAPVWSDLRTFDGRPWRGVVDIVTGGYPCQPFSFAGKRRGANDPRHLWPDIARIVGETQPGVCFFENVPGHLRLGFDVVWSDLRRLGYRVAAGLFSAAEVGAPHKRERLFILAVRDDAGPGAGEQREQGRAGIGMDRLADDSPELADAELSKPEGQRRHRREGLRKTTERHCSGGGQLADAEGSGFKRPEPAGRARTEGCPAECGGGVPLFPSGPGDIAGWRRILKIDPTLEPALCRVAHGTPAQLDRLRALGNGVVPLEAAYAFVSLWACLQE